jgi:hypothetical protein
MQPLRKIKVSSNELSFVQDNIINAVNPLLKNILMDGVMAEGWDIETTGTAIAHGLNRNPIGYIVIGKNGPGDVYKTSMDKNFLTLQSTVAVTISLWIF